jgi:hypothetical protein
VILKVFILVSRTFRFVAKLLIWAALVSGVAAQTAAPETLDPTKPPPGLSPLNAPQGVSIKQSKDVGTLEIVTRYPKPEMLTVFAEQTFFHTDRVFYSAFAPESDVWLTRAGASFVPWSTYRWTPRVTFEQAWLHFEDFPLADHSGQTLTFQSRLDLTDRKDWSWDASLNLRRLESDLDVIGEFYRQLEAGTRLNWLRPLSRTEPVFIYASAGAFWRDASPSSENRLDAGVLLSLLWYPLPELGIQPFVQTGYQYYPNDSLVLIDREDFNVRSGLSLIWQPVPKFWLGASAFWVGNFSTTDAADYEILPSVSVSASVAFW